jgi:hypothetical protein
LASFRVGSGMFRKVRYRINYSRSAVPRYTYDGTI